MSIVQQLKLWDQLIEQRIKFEELMFKCNSLPQEDDWNKLKELDKDGKLAKYQELAEEKLLELFNEYVKFENSVEQLNPNLLEKDKLVEEDKQENGNKDQEDDEKMDYESEDMEENGLDESEDDMEENGSDDEESDNEDNLNGSYDSDEKPFLDDDEQNDDELDKQNNSENLVKFNLDDKEELDDKINETENYLSSKYDRLNNVRNDILNYWFEKTRFTLKGGKLDKNSLDSFEQSTVKSINHLLLNRLKLVKRTQLKRGNYEIIGKRVENEEDADKINSELVEKRKKEIYDSEIFDDSDFYHQLLRELVNSLGASNLNQTSKVNPRWLKLMKERFKSNKYVDTKATKSRKIRYKVFNELVNFMAPMPHLSNYDNEQLDNLVKSVFGKSTVESKQADLEFSSDDSD